jgi:hypothetical protein
MANLQEIFELFIGIIIVIALAIQVAPAFLQQSFGYGIFFIIACIIIVIALILRIAGGGRREASTGRRRIIIED